MKHIMKHKALSAQNKWIYAITYVLVLSLSFGSGLVSYSHAAPMELCNGVDDDADGLTDEGFSDTDLDGQASCVDADDDNDGVADTADNDDDNDGTPDPLDVDDDNDGLPDIEICNGMDDDKDGLTDEGFADLDKDAKKNCADPDDDNDGMPDTTDPDNDNDGVLDTTDPDDDNDGINEVEICNGVDDDSDRLVDEGFVDTDRDGQKNCVDADDDADSIDDDIDTDDEGDGIEDSEDVDDDNDGKLEVEVCNGIDDDKDGETDEGAGDFDLDGANNCMDADDDNDSIADAVDPDDDNDGMPDSTDTDDDNDGKADTVDLDADNDGMDDSADVDDDNDGYADSIELIAGTNRVLAGSKPIYVVRANFTPVDNAGNPAFQSILDLAFDGNYIVASAITVSNLAVLAKIDPTTGIVISSVPLPSSGYFGLTFDGAYFYAIDKGTNPAQIVKLDPATGNIVLTLPITGVLDPVGLGYHGQLLVVDNNGGSPMLRFLDPATGALLNSLSLTGTGANSLDIDFVDGTLMSVSSAGNMYLLNMAGAALASFSALPQSSTEEDGIATDGTNVYVSHTATGGSAGVSSAMGIASASATATSGVTITRLAPINPMSPDLVMTQVTPSSSPVNAGAGLIVVNSVNNQGPGPSAAFSIGFRLSSNAVYGDADDILILTTRYVGMLAVVATNTASTTLMIPRTVLAGNYYVCAKADSGNVRVELNEDNNTLCSTAPVNVTSLPDLISSSLSAMAMAGKITIRDQVKNQGTSTAVSSTVKFYLSSDNVYQNTDTLICSRDVASLAAGIMSPSIGLAITVCPIPAGTSAARYFIIAVVDANNTVAESNEANNSKAMPLTIAPDLVSTALNFTASSGMLSIQNSVRNQGSLDAGPFTVSFYLSTDTFYQSTDPIICSRSIASLAVATSNPAIGTITSLCPIPVAPPGSYKVLMKVDSGSTVFETLEANNVRSSFGLITIP